METKKEEPKEYKCIWCGSKDRNTDTHPTWCQLNRRQGYREK